MVPTTTINIDVTIDFNKLDVNKLIDGLTHEKRLEFLAAFINIPIACVQLDKATNTWCLIICGKVPARMNGSIVTRCPIRLLSPRLVILEPTFEQIEHEMITETICAKIQTTPTWWGGSRVSILEPQRTLHRVIEHKTTVTVPRSIWRLRGLFVGADCAMPLDAAVAGDLFGPNSDMRFGTACEAGLDVTLNVENITEQEMPFHAVILGVRDEKQQRWRSHG